MLKRSRRRPVCDFLEERTMLSVAHAQLVAHRQEVRIRVAEVRSERAAARMDARLGRSDPAAVATTSTSSGGTSGSVVGGGLLAFGTPLTNSEFDLFQQVAINDNAVAFLTQLEGLKGTTASLQQASATVLNDARDLSLLATHTAQTLGVSLPAFLQGSAYTAVQKAALATNGGSFETAYISALNTIGTSLTSELQMLSASGINSTLSTFAATATPIVQTDLAAIKTVATGGTNPLTPVSTTPSSSTLSSTDLSTAETMYSYNTSEAFLGQLAALVSTNLQVQLYGEKLVMDHTMNQLNQGFYAAATGTYLPASLQGTDITTAKQVIAAVPTVTTGTGTGAGTGSTGGASSFDTTYLQAMITAHEQALSTCESTATSATNLVLKAFAVSALPTDLMHLNDALFLMRANGGASHATTSSVRVADFMGHRTIRELRR